MTIARTGRDIRRILIPLLLSILALVGLTVAANAPPPGIPSASAALTQLNKLTVAPDGSMTGYSRDKFPTWINIEGNCDTDPQLLAVDASDNESKGDRSPDQWMPPSQAFWCTYSEMYTHIKSVFKLTVTSAERSALASMIGTC